MSDRPEAPPEAQLITAALKRAKMSAREAARRAGLSDARWRQITSGYQAVSGTRVPVSAPAETLARMAEVVGVTAEQLTEAGRGDAAEELRTLPTSESVGRTPTVEELAARLAELETKFNELMSRDQRRDAS